MRRRGLGKRRWSSSTWRYRMREGMQRERRRKREVHCLQRRKKTTRTINKRSEATPTPRGTHQKGSASTARRKAIGPKTAGPTTTRREREQLGRGRRDRASRKTKRNKVSAGETTTTM